MRSASWATSPAVPRTDTAACATRYEKRGWSDNGIWQSRKKPPKTQKGATYLSGMHPPLRLLRGDRLLPPRRRRVPPRARNQIAAPAPPRRRRAPRRRLCPFRLGPAPTLEFLLGRSRPRSEGRSRAIAERRARQVVVLTVVVGHRQRGRLHGGLGGDAAERVGERGG